MVTSRGHTVYCNVRMPVTKPMRRTARPEISLPSEAALLRTRIRKAKKEGFGYGFQHNSTGRITMVKKIVKW